MEWVFVALLVNREMIVLPEKYLKPQCEQIIKNWGNGKCIPAPNPNMLKDGCIVGNNKIDCPSPLKKEQ